MFAACRCLRLHVAMSTKGEVVGRQLDVYARRDPQLAPYILRQVDKEYQRSGTKVKYVFWVAMLVAGILYDFRVEAERGHFLQPYLEKLEELSESEILDYEKRQKYAKTLLQLLEEVKNDSTRVKKTQEKVFKLL